MQEAIGSSTFPPPEKAAEEQVANLYSHIILGEVVFIPDIMAKTLNSGLVRAPCKPHTAITDSDMIQDSNSSLNSFTLFHTQTCKNLKTATRVANQNNENRDPKYNLNSQDLKFGDPMLYLEQNKLFFLNKEHIYQFLKDCHT